MTPCASPSPGTWHSETKAEAADLRFFVVQSSGGRGTISKTKGGSGSMLKRPNFLVVGSFMMDLIAPRVSPTSG